MYLQPGDRVDRYVVETLLEEGGVTAVYRVKHTELDSLHALHVLTARGTAVRDGLRREWRVQARLRHPNIVSVTDLVDIEGTPAVVSELVAGPTLAEWMTRTTAGLEAVDAIGRGLLSGMQAAHAHGLVHRDLRPSKVRLASETVPKIADFGLVTVVMANRPGLQRAGLPGAAGRAVYLAPEQIRDRDGVDERADVFALGAVLYELACRRPAFYGHDRLDTFNRVSRGVYEPPRRLQPDLPERMERAILGALVPDPDSRIPDCATLAAVWNGTLKDWQTARLDAARRRADRELGTPVVPPVRSVQRTPAPRPPASRPEPSQSASPTLVPEPALSPIASPPRQLAPPVRPPTPTRPSPAAQATPAPEPTPPVQVSGPPALDSLPPRTAPPGRATAPRSTGPVHESLPPIPSEFGVSPGMVFGAVIAAMLVGLFWWGTQPRPIDSTVVNTPPKPAQAEPAPSPPPEPEVTAAVVPAPAPAVPEPKKPAPAAPPPTAVPKPAPPAPQAAPAEPTPEPADSPWSGSTTATVTSEGGVRVWLVGAAGRFPIGEVPPGTYTIKAFFDPMQSTDAGTVRAAAGDHWALVCSKTMEVCSAQRQ